MKAEHVINIAGTVCPPEADEVFNKWYDEKHIPINMKFKGLIAVTRYRIVRSTEYATVKDYPQYLTTYKFKDLANFEVWNTSPELAAASEDIPRLFTEIGVDLLWRVQYESIRTWQNTPSLSVITIVGTQCPPEIEGRFDTWYSEKHIPDLLKFKRLDGVTRYRLASSRGLAIKIADEIPEFKAREYPKYLTFYYFKDVPTAEAYETSPERSATLEEWLDVVKEMGVSVLWRAQYEPMRTWRR